jgi:hypothetical protein
LCQVDQQKTKALETTGRGGWEQYAPGLTVFWCKLFPGGIIFALFPGNFKVKYMKMA